AGSSSATEALGSSASGYDATRRGTSVSMLMTGTSTSVSEAARLASATTSTGRALSTPWASSRAVHHALKPTDTAPMDTVAQNVTIQSAELAAAIATRSPGRTPYSSRSAAASDDTRAACSAKVRLPSRVAM